MIKLLIDFIQFLYSLAPLLTALGIWTCLAVWLSPSIKRRARVYYAVFAVPFALVAIPFIGRLCGIELFSFNRIPFLGGILRDYIHAGTLGFPLLILIMYMGALNPKSPPVKRLLAIRKELSILSGFPILTHALIRVTNNFPAALRFFAGSGGAVDSAHVNSGWGAGITNFSFVLGVLLLALFLPLWITSFDAVRKRMGAVRWKRWQRWSYGLYALLFIHALSLQIGATLNPREGRRMPAATVTETVRDRTRPSERSAPPAVTGFADLRVAPQTRRYIHIASLCVIFGSYLYLRVRKEQRRRAA
ncbi:MAG: ferric reductase-like transmembrane domain-containing protein [Dysgonamonadaceae bacterium]|jgi:DMSO/TMAO reductase YedYZ heme-binding membrane subunit|nr:ferric reductase-like transmembrane domain-containing protein [Dysgonamonadaceae bacterium]